MRYPLSAILLLAATMLSAATFAAGVPSMISYQGRLNDSGGNPVADGNYQITFSIYDVPSGGTALWTSGSVTVVVADGLFTHILGSSSALPDGLFAGSAVRYLGIKIGSDAEMTPRTQLVSTAYSHQALRADSAGYAGSVADNSVTSASISNGTIQFIDLGQNGATINQVIKWNGTAWVAAADEAGSGSGSHWNVFDSVLYTNSLWGIARGGASNLMNGDSTHTLVNLGVACTSGVYQTDAYSTISGGYGNRANYPYSTVSGGMYNRATMTGSSIAGGYGNYTFGMYAPIGGGYKNTITYNLSTICGGDSNSVHSHLAVIGGGQRNEIASDGYAGFLGGGIQNKVDGLYSTIGGGLYNNVSGTNATIAGGNGNQANGFAGTVGGGSSNYATGPYSGAFSGAGNYAGNDDLDSFAVVSGGYANYATSKYAAVPGGKYNNAKGAFSQAAGYRANADHGGTFVWADSTEGDFHSTGGNQFLIRADGGVGIGTNSPSEQLDVNGKLHLGSSGTGYVFPDTRGTNGQMLVTDGSGVLSWSAVPGSSKWTVTDSVLYTNHWLGIAKGGASNKLWGNDAYTHVNLGVRCTTGTSLTDVIHVAIGGGSNNVITDEHSTIAGGRENRITHTYGAIGGGRYNLVSEIDATIPGGYADTASGQVSFAAGGHSNVAGGTASFAAGWRAKSRHGGTFVWADASDVDFTSTGLNQFLIRAGGGVGIGTNSPAEQLDVNGKLHVRDNIKLNGNWLSNDGGDEGIYVASDGYVGVGETSPNGPLHVYDAGVNISTGTNFADRVAPLVVGRDDTGYGTILIDGNQIEQARTDDRLYLNFNSSSDISLANGGGDVGIGTNSPTAKLHVVGNICYTGSIGACSDARYKKNVAKIEDALATLLKIQGVTYNWRQEDFPDQKFDDQTHLGFLAQELKELVPEVVMVDDNGYMSVDYGRLTPLLVEALKQLQGENDDLKARLAKIEALLQQLIDSNQSR